MYKIRLASGHFYANRKGRIQHYASSAEARRKIERLGARAKGARVVEATKKGRPKSGKGTKSKRYGKSRKSQKGNKGHKGRGHKRTRRNKYGSQTAFPYML